MDFAEESNFEGNNSVLFKGSETVSNQLDPKLMLSFYQTSDKNYGDTYEEFNKLHYFDSSNVSHSKLLSSLTCLVVSPSLNASNSEIQKSTVIL